MRKGQWLSAVSLCLMTMRLGVGMEAGQDEAGAFSLRPTLLETDSGPKPAPKCLLSLTPPKRCSHGPCANKLGWAGAGGVPLSSPSIERGKTALGFQQLQPPSKAQGFLPQQENRGCSCLSPTSSEELSYPLDHWKMGPSLIPGQPT